MIKPTKSARLVGHLAGFRRLPQGLGTAENVIGILQHADHDIRWCPIVILETFRPVKRYVSLLIELAIADLDIRRYARDADADAGFCHQVVLAR